MAVLKPPVVLKDSAAAPAAVLTTPVVLLASAATPGGCVGTADGVAKERFKTNRRVVAAGCQAKERILTLSSVLVGVASVRWWANRLRSWR